MGRYIVTGGSGFIGSNLVERLVLEGHEITVIDNFHTGNKKNLEGLSVEIVEGNASKITTTNTAVDGVFHLGVYSSSPMYKKDPHLVSRAIDDFISILEFCKKNKCKLVFASTSSIYNGNEIPWREDMEIKVTDYYTEARYYMERLAKLYNKLHGVESIGLRLFSIYGPKEEYKGKYANIITQFLWDIMKDKSPVIFGDGEQTRDFVYVTDVVDAFLIAMDSDIKCDIFNVGFGKNYSFNEVVELINKKLGKEIKPTYVENPIKNYVYHTLADTEKSEKILGFKAKIDLEEGLNRLIEYYKMV